MCWGIFNMSGKGANKKGYSGGISGINSTPGMYIIYSSEIVK